MGKMHYSEQKGHVKNPTLYVCPGPHWDQSLNPVCGGGIISTAKVGDVRVLEIPIGNLPHPGTTTQ